MSLPSQIAHRVRGGRGAGEAPLRERREILAQPRGPVTHARLLPLVIVLALNVSSSAAQDPAATWRQLGPRLKAGTSNFVEVDASRHALAPALAGAPDLLYMTWLEMNPNGIPNVHVKRWDGTAWTLDGGTLNHDRMSFAFDPSIAIAGGVPYVAWTELNKARVAQIFVKHRAPREWVQDGTALNADPRHPALRPTLAAGADAPLHLAWSEADARRIHHVYVKRLDPDGWTAIGGPLNVDKGRDAFDVSISLVGSEPYVAWSEATAGTVPQLHVKRWDGNRWHEVGGALNRDPQRPAVSPVLCAGEDSLYLAWIELDADGRPQLQLGHYLKGAWRPIGNPAAPGAAYALTPALSYFDGTLYVSWTSTDAGGVSRIQVSQWDGTAWKAGSQLNVIGEKAALTPALSIWKGKPVVAWKELEANGVFTLAVKQQQ